MQRRRSSLAAGLWNGLLAVPHRAPRTILVFAALVTFGFGILAFRFQVDSAVDQLLPSSDPDRTYYDGVRSVFGSEEIAVVGIFARDVFSASTLGRVQHLTTALSRINGVRQVVSLTNLEEVRFGESGLTTDRLMPPLPHTPAVTHRFRRRALAHPIARKLIVSPNGDATAIMVEFEAMDDRVFLDRRLDEQLREAVSRVGGPEAVAITGLPTIKVHAARYMIEDLARFVPLGILVVFLVLAWAFRRWRGVLLPMSTVLVGLAITLGAMVAAGSAFTMGTLVLPPLLVAVGVAYGIHIVNRYEHEPHEYMPSGNAVAAAMAHVRVPVAMAAATTVAGFSTFIGNPIPSIHDFGIYSTLGITAILAASLAVIPAALTLTPQLTPWKDGWDTALLERTGTLAIRWRRLVLLIGGIVVTAGLWSARRISVETDYLSFFPPDSAVRVDNARIATAIAGTQLVSVVLDGAGPESATQVETLDGLRSLQRFVAAQPGVDTTVSLLDYIETVRRVVAPERADSPFTDQREVDQLLLLLRPNDIDQTVNRDFSRLNLTAHTRLSGSRDMRNFVTRVEAYAADRLPPRVRVKATGTAVLLNRSADALASAQVTGLAQVFIVLLVLMICLFRSPWWGLLSMVPNVVPVVLLFGIMGWADIDLNICTSMIAAIAIGIAVDDTIHYLRGYATALQHSDSREAAVLNTVATVGQPILITSVALAAGFLVVCASHFQPIRHFGVLASSTMVIALLADLFLLPALLVSLPVGTPAGAAADGRPSSATVRMDNGTC